MNNHFNDEHDFTNDDGYLDSLLDNTNIPQEWLDEEEAYWSEDTLDPSDEDEYDPVDEGDDGEVSHASDEDEDEQDYDTPIGPDYDGYNDPDNY